MRNGDRGAPVAPGADGRGGSRRRRPLGRRLASSFTGTLAALAIAPSGLLASNVQQEERGRELAWGGAPATETAATAAWTSEAADDLFVIEPPVGVLLRELWLESRAVSMERVACLGGYFDERDEVVHVTRLEPFPSQADSLRSEAGPSLETCAPPMWSGTVHTHIALFRGQPYSTFSPNDRAVMGAWRHRWRQEGLFCVLYSESLAYCEWGPALSGDVAYNETPAPVVGSVVGAE